MARLPTMRPTLRTISTRSVVAIRGDAMARSVKPTLDFYGSAAWKEVRLEVQRACKRTCQRCRKTDTRIYVDHIVELKDGGEPLERSNLIGLCAVCHGKKTAQERANRVAATNRSLGMRPEFTQLADK